MSTLSETGKICTDIRKHILSAENPFCITDLFAEFHSVGISNRDLILEVLDELYERGIVQYRCCGDTADGPEWAFYVI